MLTHTHLAGGIAAAAGAALLLDVPAAQLAPLVLGAAIGAGLPDVDCPHSKPAQILAVAEGAILGGVAGWYISRSFLIAGAGALAGAGLGGPGLLLLLAALYLAPAIWRTLALAGVAALGVAGLAIRRHRRWSLLGGAVASAGGHRGPTHSLLFVGLALGAGWLLEHFSVLPFACPWWALGLGVLSHLFLDSFTEGGVRWFWPAKNRVAFLPLKTGGVLESAVILPALLGAIFLVGARVIGLELPWP